MNLIRKLRRLVFGHRAVDSIVSSFHRTVEELHHTAAKLDQHAKQKHARASALATEAVHHECDAIRARKTATKISDLVDFE